MVFKIMKNKSVRTEIQKSFLWNFKLYAFIGCLAFPLNVLGESVSFDTDNVAFMSPSQRIKVTGIEKDEAGDRKSTRLNSSHSGESRMPSSA